MLSRSRDPTHWIYRHFRTRLAPGSKDIRCRQYHRSSPRQLDLYNSLNEKIESVPFSHEKGLAVYTCGPTTYAPSHLGHARTYVQLDIMRRILDHEAASQGRPRPLFVMNITDVDDKILATAEENGEAPLELARRYEREFWRDMDALNCLRPQVVTRVTEYVESDIIPYIQRLVENGAAYETSDGVYFDVQAFERTNTFTKYGKLAPPASAEDFYTRLDTQSQEKKSSRDFALWKRRKTGERMYWASPWGDGRPGWHIECSAMIEAVRKQFQDTHNFFLHTGGVDLKFPHHTNEIAQAEAFSGKDWIPHWVHTGHLHIDGHKMSKSLKNFITIEEMISEFDDQSLYSSPADDFRLWCLGLSGSYRSLATYSRDRLLEARQSREKILKVLNQAAGHIKEKEARASGSKWTEGDHALFRFAESEIAQGLLLLKRDMDGSSFVKALVGVAERLRSHLEAQDSAPDAVREVSSRIRDVLRFLGFSAKTYGVGLDEVSDTGSTSMILGGERAIVERLVVFRHGIRAAAIDGMSNPNPNENLKEILSLCDELRDVDLPSIGVEVNDPKADETTAPQWNFCIPKSLSGTAKHEDENRQSPPVAIDMTSVPLQDYFKIGQYSGSFSEYDIQGIPLKNSDGSEVSKRQRKKFEKKLEKHARRLEKE